MHFLLFDNLAKIWWRPGQNTPEFSPEARLWFTISLHYLLQRSKSNMLFTGNVIGVTLQRIILLVSATFIEGIKATGCKVSFLRILKAL